MAQGKDDNLEAFAKRVISRLKDGASSDSLERLLCRLMTGEDLKVSAAIASKVVEWRYGKPKQELVGPNGSAIPVQIITNLQLPPK